MIKVESVKDQEEVGAFPRAFSNSFPFAPGLDAHLEEALRHVLDHPGSLIRPRIVVQMGGAFGWDLERARELAIALEYFHSASLLFDDLPCMDNALERRGVPCAHLGFGEAGAILAALGLINRAYALAWKALTGAAADRQLRALAFLEQRLGVEGLLNGQSLDLHYRYLPHTREITEGIARGKTVSLIRLTLVLPAMMGDASARELQLLERLSVFWGLSYQIIDDLKDMVQSEAQTGKTPGRDVLLDRPNTAVVIGIPGAIDRAGRMIRAGDSTFKCLLKTRGGVGFLESLHEKLNGELSILSEAAMRPIAGGRV